MKRGDIYVAAARGTYAVKPRPVVIVQADSFGATASITICPLTTNPLDAPLMRIAVDPTPTTGIEHRSRIMIDKITTIPRENVREHLGRLADADVVRLRRALIVFLGLAD